MKKLSVYVATMVVAMNGFGQVNEEIVSLGQGYQNQAFYSLANGEIDQIARNSWDLAFDASGFGSAIRINDAKGLKLYEYPNGDNSLFGEPLDTTGLTTWTELINSDITWSEGAFNANRNTADDFDLGWGTYNTVTHAITGKALYILQLADNSCLQVEVQSLSAGTFTFRYADLNGGNIVDATIAKSNFSGKNFGYFHLASNEVLDLEPTNSTEWDLLFTTYTTLLGPDMPYGVTGVLSNKDIQVAKVEEIDNVATFINWQGQDFSEDINTIGYDWKSLNYQTFTFDIQDDVVYFAKTADESIWKIVFTGFGGSANGNFEFTTELISTASISNHEKSDSKFTVYPNPVQNQNINIVYDLPSNENAELFITDLSGKIVQHEFFNANEGLTAKQIHLTDLKAGIYLVNLKLNNGILTQKLIIQ